MKFLHISDLHLGRRLSAFSLCEFQSVQLENILKYIDENNIDSVLISGDIYDKSIPTIEAISIFDDFITSLSERHIKVFIISGNHDSPERLQFASRLLKAGNIYIAGSFQGSPEKITLKDEFGNINIYLMPFVKFSQLSSLYPEENFMSFSDALEKVMSDISIDTQERNILLYHGFVIFDNKEPELSDSESQLGGMSIVDAEIFSDFDYTALGHIHKPQSIAKNIRYSGSLMKYSFSETNQKKSFTVIDMKEKGNLEITVHPLENIRDMRIIRGYFNNIIENGSESDDFIRIELEDKEKVPFALEQLREKYYKNILEFVYLKDLEFIKASSTSAVAENRSMIELAQEFFVKIYNEELNREKLEIISEICKEVEDIK